MQKHIGYINRSNFGHKHRHGQDTFEHVSSWRVYEEDGELRCVKVRRDYCYQYDDAECGYYTRIFDEPHDLCEDYYEVLLRAEDGVNYGVNVFFNEFFDEEEFEKAQAFCNEHNGEIVKEKCWINDKMMWKVTYVHHFETYGKIEEECQDFYDYEAEYDDRELTDRRPIEL